MPVVSFQSFVIEFRRDFPELCKLYPPGPTVQDISEWYGETRFRCERVVEYCEKHGNVTRVIGAGKRIYVVTPEDAKRADRDYFKLTELQRKVLLVLLNLSQLQESDRIEYSIMSIANTIKSSNGAVHTALKRLAKYGFVEFVQVYDRAKHKAILDLKLDH